MVRALFVLAVGGFVLMPVTGRAQQGAEKGQQVFAAQKCSLCHAVAGKGNAKGSLDGVGAKWKAEELRQWIVNAKDMAATHKATRKPPMKDYSKLSKADVDALVAYLQTLK
jgi:mono/diheme cytochrome c family protein